nr:hypothetical protein [Ralstonia solanacearum]
MRSTTARPAVLPWPGTSEFRREINDLRKTNERYACKTHSNSFDSMMKTTKKQNKGKSDYFSAGKPVHRLSYCAFLDVLGFSERIRASYKDGSADKLLESFHKILARSIAQFKKSTDGRCCINQGRGEAVLTFTRNDMAVTL